MASQAITRRSTATPPDLVGNDLNAYIAAGVYSDHECHDLNDAIAKLQRGQFIMIREGTAAAIWKRWSPCCATSMWNAVCSAPMTSTPTTCWKRVTSTTSSKGHLPGCRPHHRHQGRLPHAARYFC